MTRWDRLFIRRKRMREDLDQDIRDYIKRETEDNIDRGLSPDKMRPRNSGERGSTMCHFCSAGDWHRLFLAPHSVMLPSSATSTNLFVAQSLNWATW